MNGGRRYTQRDTAWAERTRRLPVRRGSASAAGTVRPETFHPREERGRQPASCARLGFTLVEIAVSIAVLSILCGVVLTGLIHSLRVETQRQYIKGLDLQGSRIIQEVTAALRPGILPIEIKDEEKLTNKAVMFKLLDDKNLGFGGANGKAWRNALQAGVDRVAFVVPVDAQNDGDTLDDAASEPGHIEVGQIRRDGVASLDTAFTYSAGTDTFLLSTTVPASSLVAVSTAQLADDDVGGDPAATGWPAALYNAGAAPPTSAFTVIRYVPQRDSGGALVTVSEANLQLDLDGDGAYASVFNLGRLQLVYVGGTHAVQPDGPGIPVVTANVQTQIIELSGDYVLRNVVAADREPMFRLVRYSAGNLTSGGVANLDSGTGSLALGVKVNLFDREGYLSMRPRMSYSQHDQLNRVYEATVMLRNMAR